MQRALMQFFKPENWFTVRAGGDAAVFFMDALSMTPEVVAAVAVTRTPRLGTGICTQKRSVLRKMDALGPLFELYRRTSIITGQGGLWRVGS